ncbi:MAG: hypothetical protein AB7S38_05010 [Vulcanimicrobiota bacterium]
MRGREAGLDGPRQLFQSWLRSNGRGELAGRLDLLAEEIELPDPARQAFEQRRFEEAITLARQASDPQLEAQAEEAFAGQAALALAEDHRSLALSVYRRLLALYPERAF